MDYLDTRTPETPHSEAERHVTALYQAHALSLARLALLMLGDRHAAQDVVQDAFFGLYRRWDGLASADAAPAYLRTSVLNGCRNALRRRSRQALSVADEALESAESALVHTEERRALLAAVRRLPARQREVLVLRYYLDEPEGVIAASLGIGASTVRSTLHRALKALGADLREQA